MNLSNFIKEDLLDHIIGLDPVASRYLTLVTATPTAASTGSSIVEPVYAGYGRESYSSGDWSATVDGLRTNDVEVAFAPTVASIAVVAVVMVDAAAAGNMIAYGEFPEAPVTITAGDTPRFPAGFLGVTLSELIVL